MRYLAVGKVLNTNQQQYPTPLPRQWVQSENHSALGWQRTPASGAPPRATGNYAVQGREEQNAHVFVMPLGSELIEHEHQRFVDEGVRLGSIAQQGARIAAECRNTELDVSYGPHHGSLFWRRRLLLRTSLHMEIFLGSASREVP